MSASVYTLKVVTIQSVAPARSAIFAGANDTDRSRREFIAAMDLLVKLKFWHPAPAHLSQEHAFFREKVAPLIPEILQALESQAGEIATLNQTVRAKDIEIENLRVLHARIDRYESESRELKANIARKQPEIDGLKRKIAHAMNALQNGDG